MAKLLLVDDDETLCGVVLNCLTQEQHVVDCAHTGSEAQDLLALYSYDAIMLDWGLPDIQGVEVCSHYRASGGKAAILMLTGKNSIDSKELGLDSGADDYLTKPFEMRELSARLRALLRRPATVVTNNILELHDLTLNTKTCTLTKGGAEVKLRPKEYAILEYLMRHQNQVCSADEIIDHAWKAEDGVSPETLRSSMSRLRKQIDDEGSPSFIEHLSRTGYIIKPPGARCDEWFEES